jgi:hypothetical protein
MINRTKCHIKVSELAPDFNLFLLQDTFGIARSIRSLLPRDGVRLTEADIPRVCDTGRLGMGLLEDRILEPTFTPTNRHGAINASPALRNISSGREFVSDGSCSTARHEGWFGSRLIPWTCTHMGSRWLSYRLSAPHQVRVWCCPILLEF